MCPRVDPNRLHPRVLNAPILSGADGVAQTQTRCVWHWGNDATAAGILNVKQQWSSFKEQHLESRGRGVHLETVLGTSEYFGCFLLDIWFCSCSASFLSVCYVLFRILVSLVPSGFPSTVFFAWVKFIFLFVSFSSPVMFWVLLQCYFRVTWLLGFSLYFFNVLKYKAKPLLWSDAV